MKLGGSLRRSRKRSERGPARAFRNALLGLVVLAAGLGGGYLVATELLFPAPEPPEELVEVPALQGTPREEAAGRIRELGLVVGPPDSLRHPTRLPGAVVGQSPLPGQMALPGDTVRFTWSLGPETRPVPDVSRLRIRRAREMLAATGFEVAVDTVEAPEPRGTVLAVEPEAGTEVTLPGKVRIRMSLGPPQVRMPVLLGMTEHRAIQALDSLGLVVGEVGTQFRFGLARGIVVEQEPPAGAMVDRGSSVRIVVGRREE